MKITILALLVLLFAMSTKPLVGAAPEQVVDTTGKKLRSGSNYYLIPASPDIGGLGLASTGKGCPLDVVAVDGYQGLALLFVPVNMKKDVVRVNTDLNIYFYNETSCPNSNVWTVEEYDYATGQWFVTTGGILSDPGLQTIRNWFKIEKYEDAYKLIYCPSVCTSCKTHLCRDMGIYEDQYGKRLALTNVPYKVRFELA